MLYLPPSRKGESAPSKAWARILITGVALIGLSGCGVLGDGFYDTPLPGGADLGKNPYSLSAEFDDVLDLVPQSSVKVDNVAVGKVTNIKLSKDRRSAIVTTSINGDVELPAGTTARIQQTTLLGEKYVAFVKPSEPEAGPDLKDGDHIAAGDTSQAAEVEEVLGALSMVLNGGGIGQFQEISRELQAVSEGRPEEIKGFLRTMDDFVSTIDERSEAITNAIDELDSLSRTLDNDRDKISNALEDLSPGMKVMADQRRDLVEMLEALDRLSAVSVETLNASQDDIVASLESLAPILEQLAAAGEDLPQSLEILLTYPFPDSVLGAIKGDYMNVFITTNFRTPGGMWMQPTGDGVVARGSSWPLVDDSPPTLLPPTDSVTPTDPRPTITVPTEVPRTPTAPPTDRPTQEPTPTKTLPVPTSRPSSGSGATDGNAK